MTSKPWPRCLTDLIPEAYDIYLLPVAGQLRDDPVGPRAAERPEQGRQTTVHSTLRTMAAR